jgi:hypothetical protein
MPPELKPTPWRAIDQAQLCKEFSAIEARQAVLIQQGRKL